MFNLIQRVVFILVVIVLIKGQVKAHDNHSSSMQYLGNEAVMVTDKNSKILFDPFFHNNYRIYTLVPEKTRQAIFNGNEPYNNIDAIFISHAHGDHFAADDVLKFLQKHDKVKLIAPQQAVNTLLALPGSDSIKSQLNSIDLNFGDKAVNFKVGQIEVGAVRIPHSGWPQRAKVENLVYRVTLNDNISVMHMGDADANDSHFKPHNDFWQQRVTDVALPPYWFLTSLEGNKILDSRINSKKNIGIHVPTIVPESLMKSQKDYFSMPGEIRVIKLDK